jgi:UDP-glucose-4-epimerase GalE
MTRDALLVTGGVGFVGSHFVRAALESRRRVVVLDDRSGGSAAVAPAGVEFVRGDIGDAPLVRSLCTRVGVGAVVHFAGKIQVGESVRAPKLYFDVNLVRSLTLIDAARDAGVDTFLFSSSAAVYGAPAQVPIPESAPCAPESPYGSSKLAVEHVLRAYGVAHGLRWAALRYFNAAGAHPDGTMIEAHEPETHLIPLVLDAALGRRPPPTIFGDDYTTPDGTCVRDYVHVCDLARAHLAALDVLGTGSHVAELNLASGRGFSVKEVIEATGRLMKAPIAHTIGPRRPGDPPILVADAARAQAILGWRPHRSDLETILEDALRSRLPGK